MRGLELLAFSINQPTTGQAVKEKAADLFSDLATNLLSASVEEIEARAQARKLDDVVAEMLSEG